MVTTNGNTFEPVKFPLSIPTDPKFVYDVKRHFPPLSFFEKDMLHPAVIIPSKRTAELRRTLTDLLMRRPKVKNVYPVPMEESVEGIDVRQERKLVLKILPLQDNADSSHDIYDCPVLQALFPSNNTNTTNTTTTTTTNNNNNNNNNNKNSNDDKHGNVRKSTFVFKTNYSHYNVEETLRQLLPSSLPEIPAAFEIVGHIAHLNLRDDCLPYRYIIGKVILDKNTPTIKLVVNKIGNVEGEFRTFPMEIIASSLPGKNSITSGGENRNGNEKSSSMDTQMDKMNENMLEVEVKEEGCKFQLNFQHVYWNSRLQFEHKRLVQLIAGKKHNNKKQVDIKHNNGSTIEISSVNSIVVADVMAGVGPFAVPLASKHKNVTVHANDLNPRSHHYLKKNATINKCGDRLIHYNMDGRAFIHHLIKSKITFDHAIMNLPAIAIEFLDAFRGYDYACDKQKAQTGAPFIHVHCFASKDEEKAEKEVFDRCEAALGCALHKERDCVNIHVVRDISPRKNMLCVSFRLPASVKDVETIIIVNDVDTNQVVLENSEEKNESSEPDTKKARFHS